VRRFFSFLYLLGAGAIMLASFADYVRVEDTSSLHWGAGVWDSIALWGSVAGLALLLVGLARHLFAARWVLGGTLLACTGLSIHSLLRYPREADDPAYSMVLPRSRTELYGLLIASIVLLLLTMFEKRLRRTR
jgi:hypothetical protein